MVPTLQDSKGLNWGSICVKYLTHAWSSAGEQIGLDRHTVNTYQRCMREGGFPSGSPEMVKV